MAARVTLSEVQMGARESMDHGGVGSLSIACHPPMWTTRDCLRTDLANRCFASGLDPTRRCNVQQDERA